MSLILIELVEDTQYFVENIDDIKSVDYIPMDDGDIKYFVKDIDDIEDVDDIY